VQTLPRHPGSPALQALVGDELVRCSGDRPPNTFRLSHTVVIPTIGKHWIRKDCSFYDGSVATVDKTLRQDKQ